MLSLLLAYALFNAACVAVLVVIAHDPPLVEDDPLPASILLLPTNANDNAAEKPVAAPLAASELASRPLRPMHAVA
jgi:hypothetical protein